MMRFRLAATLALLLTGGVASPAARAQSGDVRISYEHFTLPNGLQVILHRDPTTPTVTTNVWYHVGSAHERTGRTGFAHLFEHLMFEGSRNVPEGKIDEWFEEVGGSPNGTTSRDRTNYFQTFARNGLEMALFIESDRMAYLLEAMSPELVDGQRAVVKNERRQSIENRPYGLAMEVLGETLYPESHPYHWPVVGYMDDLAAASYEDVVHFFETFYVPNNASLVVAGDIDLAETRRLVEKWFGELPRGADVPRLALEQHALTAEKRVTLEDRVQLPRLYMAWITPAAFEPGDAESHVIADLLAGGRNSRLYERLVYDLEIAQDVSAFQRSGLLNSELVVTATARAGRSLDELQEAVDQEIERLKEELPSGRELERILNQREMRFLEGLESLSAKADQLNSYLFYTGRPGFFGEDLARYHAISAEAVRAQAREVLPANRRVILSVVPEGRTELAISGSDLVHKQRLED